MSLTLADFLRKTVNRQEFVQVSEGALYGSSETYRTREIAQRGLGSPRYETECLDHVYLSV